MITLVLLLIIITIVAVFSVQNAAPVAITFLFWRFEASIAIVVFLSVLCGAVIAAITIFSIRVRQSKKPKPREGGGIA